MRELGTVSGVEPGILYIQGLENVMAGELLELEGGARAVALRLERERVVAGLLDNPPRHPSEVHGTGRFPATPVGTATLGRILDPLGRPLDQKEALDEAPYRLLSARLWPASKQHWSSELLWTGVRRIDLLQPLGRGESRLLVGESQTGKTPLAVDATVYQARLKHPCIFVAVGWEFGALARVVATFQQQSVFEQVVVVATRASAPPALQLMAPVAGAIIAQSFAELGQQAFLVVDDLTAYAAAARALALAQLQPLTGSGQAHNLPQLLWQILERSGVYKSSAGTGSVTTLALLRAVPGDPTDDVFHTLKTDRQRMLVTDRTLAAAGRFPALAPPPFHTKRGPPGLPRDLRRLAGLVHMDLAMTADLRERATTLKVDPDDSIRTCLDRGMRIEAMLQQPAHTFSSPEDLLQWVTAMR